MEEAIPLFPVVLSGTISSIYRVCETVALDIIVVWVGTTPSPLDTRSVTIKTSSPYISSLRHYHLSLPHA